jgi:hypothetical protein
LLLEGQVSRLARLRIGTGNAPGVLAAIAGGEALYVRATKGR